MNRILPSLLVLVLALGGLSRAVHAERITVTHDRDAGTATITIRAVDGLVSWSDVLRGLAPGRPCALGHQTMKPLFCGRGCGGMHGRCPANG